MNRKFNSQNEKDIFLIYKLWSYLCKKILDTQESDLKKELIKRVAAMYIYPFVGEDNEIYFGSLTEQGISWFYLREGESREEKSSKNYRIFANSVFDKEIYIKIIDIFGPRANQIGYIQPFSNDVVIRAILTEMEKEKDYTKKWWTCARDIYQLWNRTVSGYAFSSATKNIDNNYFLFDSNYCDEKHKKMIIALKVFRDITQHPDSKIFWESFSKNDINTGIELLRYLGVPHTFSNNGNINIYLRDLYRIIRNKVIFPVNAEDKIGMGLCELGHYILFNVIYLHDNIGFLRIIDNPELSGSIPVRNANNTYTSIAYSMFYEQQREENRTTVNEEEKAAANKRLDAIRVLPGFYREDMLRNMNNARPFGQLIQPFRDYNFHNIRIREPEFYRWAWRYTKNQQLINNILEYFSGLQRRYIPEEFNEFAVDAASRLNRNSGRTYHFDMVFSGREALQNRENINMIMQNQNLSGIRPIVTEYLDKVNSTEIKYRIMRTLMCGQNIRDQIESDILWNRIYRYPIDSVGMNGQYVRIFYLLDGEYQPQQILLVSDNYDDSVTEDIVLNYIQNVYDIEIDDIIRDDRNWKEDFINLTFGIRDFLTKQIEIPVETMSGNQFLSLEDIVNYKNELELWNRLKIARQELMQEDDNKYRGDVQVFGWGDFLREKYRGKCQICGSRIPMDHTEDYSFRLYNEENSFANIASNLFCLCPTCHGRMRFGRRKRELRSIPQLANQYLVQMKHEEGRSVNAPAVISQFSFDGRVEQGFENPITCDICIDGENQRIYFSWEHFLRLAFIFFDEDKDYTYAGEIGDLMQLFRMLSTHN